ncbi:defensin-A-like [Hyposmocoma kahamanoa]|uniref:defensin-A-like n=1 Tax=Hyposmocoma kahamanoa TaxID=1477025 RepID=UPI000E6D8A98|nr:defensin-A-like [Hyposmocoma kahamanoa]
MAKIVIVLFVVTMAVAALAVPVKEPEEGAEYENEFFDFQPDSSVIQSPRITCDLLSGVVGGPHTLCATHCILKGFRGGYCSDKGVCICRN